MSPDELEASRRRATSRGLRARRGVVGVFVLLALTVAPLLVTHSTFLAHGGIGGLRSLSLGLRDVPTGLSLVESRPVTNADVIKVTALASHVLAYLGRVGGYETEFRRVGGGGLYHIKDVVSQFRSATGAEMRDVLYQSDLNSYLFLKVHYKPLPRVRVGDYALAYAATVRRDGLAFASVLLYFRKGMMSAVLEAEWLMRTFTTAQVLGLARTIEGRFARAISSGLYASVAHAPAPLSALAVRLKDLQPGYRPLKRGYCSSIGPSERHGGILGYIAKFFDGAHARSAAALVFTDVMTYRSTSGALWGYLHYRQYGDWVKRLPRAYRLQQLHSLSLTPLGNKSTAFTIAFRWHGYKQGLTLIFWLRGHYVAMVGVGATFYSVNTGELLRLAQLQDARIKKIG